jgi:hypothetical protein
MTSQMFSQRMADLDAIVEQCSGRGPFATGAVRDASNRSNRDWPWWGVEITQTEIEGSENRRATACVTLKSTQAGEPGAFEADWRAQVWQGVGQDIFSQRGSMPIDWQQPTPTMLQETMAALLQEAQSAISRRSPP